VRILGLDPGTGTFGFGVVENSEADQLDFTYVTSGVLTTKPGTVQSERLLEIYADLTKIIQKYNPEIVAIEKLYFSSNVTTAMAVSEARGVAQLACAQQGLAVIECSPSQIKSAVTGIGSAEKKQVQEMIKTILQLDAVPSPDDAADALAVAPCAPQIARSRTYEESNH